MKNIFALSALSLAFASSAFAGSSYVTGNVIKKAYKRLAMKFHPDRNQGDESAADKFKEVKEAIDAKVQALMTASQKLMEIAQQQAQAQQAQGADAGAQSKEDDVVDAEFEEVKDDKK